MKKNTEGNVKHRVVHNLVEISRQTQQSSFRIEGPEKLTELLTDMSWAVTLDLKSSFHIAIQLTYQPLFGFRYKGHTYQQAALPFGWSESPHTYSWWWSR